MHILHKSFISLLNIKGKKKNNISRRRLHLNLEE